MKLPTSHQRSPQLTTHTTTQATRQYQRFTSSSLPNDTTTAILNTTTTTTTSNSNSINNSIQLQQYQHQQHSVNRTSKLQVQQQPPPPPPPPTMSFIIGGRNNSNNNSGAGAGSCLPVFPSEGCSSSNGGTEERELKAESPTSDYGDESNDATDSGGDASSQGYHPQTLGNDRLHPAVANTQQNAAPSKPPYSFSCLIFMAIEDSEENALPVKSIYKWVVNQFPYFDTAPTGWKNSVRHNLSLNKCFRKVDKSPNLGKGSLWMVDPAHRPTLLQSLSKVPYHPYSSLDKVYMLSTRHNKNSGGSTDCPSNGSPITLGNQQLCAVSHSNASGKPINKEFVRHNGAKPNQQTDSSRDGANTNYNNNHNTVSIQDLHQQQQHQLLMQQQQQKQQQQQQHNKQQFVSSAQSFNGFFDIIKTEGNAPPVTENKNLINNNSGGGGGGGAGGGGAGGGGGGGSGGGNSPDPALFPYLARRLGGVAALSSVAGLSGVELEDVDAANAMLTLKHGHQVITPIFSGSPSSMSMMDRDDASVAEAESAAGKKKRKRDQVSEAAQMLISSSARLDHSYTNSPAKPSSSSSSPPSSCYSSSFSSPSSSTPPTPPHLIIPTAVRMRARGHAVVAPGSKPKDAASPTSSVDEAFSDESFESDVGDAGNSPSDLQQMVDGADALLNFAARATTLMPKLMMLHHIQPSTDNTNQHLLGGGHNTTQLGDNQKYSNQPQQLNYNTKADVPQQQQQRQLQPVRNLEAIHQEGSISYHRRNSSSHLEDADDASDDMMRPVKKLLIDSFDEDKDRTDDVPLYSTEIVVSATDDDNKPEISSHGSSRALKTGRGSKTKKHPVSKTVFNQSSLLKNFASKGSSFHGCSANKGVSKTSRSFFGGASAHNTNTNVANNNNNNACSVAKNIIKSKRSNNTKLSVKPHILGRR